MSYDWYDWQVSVKLGPIQKDANTNTKNTKKQNVSCWLCGGVGNFIVGVGRRHLTDPSQKPRTKIQTSQELRMLFSVTLNCQVTKIVMNSGSQCQTCNQCLRCHKSLGSLFEGALLIYLSQSLSFFWSGHVPFITLIKCLRGHNSLGSLFLGVL